MKNHTIAHGIIFLIVMLLATEVQAITWYNEFNGKFSQKSDSTEVIIHPSAEKGSPRPGVYVLNKHKILREKLHQDGYDIISGWGIFIIVVISMTAGIVCVKILSKQED